MTIAEISFYEVDGQLGAVDNSELPIAIAGLALRGSYEPRLFARYEDAVAEYGAGDLIEAGAVQIKDWSKPALLCRINAADVGEATLVLTGWTGTATPAVHSAGLAPIETAEYRIKCISGGTRGTDGITYVESYDGGRSYGPLKQLGVAIAFTLNAAIVGTVVIDLGAGTCTAGEEFIVRTVAPIPTAAEVTTAVDQLGVHSQDWDCLEVSCPIDATIASALDTALATMSGRVQERYWVANARLPLPSESIPTYVTAMTAAWGSYSTLRGHVFPGNCHFVSRVNQLKCVRPRVWAVAPYIDRLPRQIDPAHLDNGALPGVTLVDDNGNPQLHDERIWPAFDALRLSSLYSAGRDGVFIGNARTKSPVGSDYRYVQIRRVINVSKRILYAYLRKVLNKDVIVSKKTGRLTPSYVRFLKSGAETSVLSVLSVGPMVSSIEVTPDGNAQVLTNETVDFDFDVVPKGYIKNIRVRVSMRNPAMTVVG
jgi:hypothetical protein